MEKLIRNENSFSIDFKKLNLLVMIVLSFITLGAYIGVWFLRNRHSIENFNYKTGIHFGLWRLFTIISFIFLFIQIFGNFVLSDYGIANLESYEIIFNFFFIGLLYYSIFRLREILEQEVDVPLKNYLLFIFHVFYIQYKMNQIQTLQLKVKR
ncbi:DUF4234 domain-containing protein [Lysinibacillus telephonicus]|uniref:DUF4234 domain-containing protein n=1 Tax=Lysinibacillus telephonicus TaxID=1714840 RepID=A0A431UUD9_9BACI|nr:DUF4234 domain-containing protein [Lysinibacillus telephonicus]RTQ94047.1 hypothetical protein EKG35_07000 [Lysinibacillus telephonicus]